MPLQTMEDVEDVSEQQEPDEAIEEAQEEAETEEAAEEADGDAAEEQDEGDSDSDGDDGLAQAYDGIAKDPDELSNRVKKRIGKLHHEKMVARTEAEKLRKQVESLNKRMQELQKVRHTETLEQIEARESGVKQRLRQAIEDGDTDKQLELNDELLELKLRRQKGPDALPEAEEEEGQPEQPQMTQAAQNYLEHIRPRMDAIAAKHGNAVAKKIWDTTIFMEQQMSSEGYDINDDTTYAELDRAVIKQFPDVFPSGKQPKKAAKKPPGGANAAPPGRGGEVGTRTPKKGGLTKKDLASMERYGFDPNSKRDREAWLRRNEI